MSPDNSLTPAEVAELYVSLQADLRRMCIQLTRDVNVAEDALQTAMLKLLRHGAALRQAESPRAWIFRSVARCCLDELRVCARATPVSGHPLQLPADPERSTRELEARDTVLRALELLDNSELSLAIAHYVDQVDQAELAERAHCSRQTLHQRLKRIRSKLAALHDERSAPLLFGNAEKSHVRP